MAQTQAKRTFISVLWAAIGRIGRAVGQIIFMIALGRAVGPAGFGAATVALIGYQLISTLASQSFSQALVRLDTPAPSTKSTAFWLNMGLSGFVALTIIGCTPFLVGLLEIDDLMWLVPALVISGLLGAPTVLAQAALSKDMRFKRIASIETLGTIAGTIAGLIVLWCNGGLWGLVAFAFVQRLTELVLFRQAHQLWPEEKPDRSASKGLLSFTAPLAGFQILTFFNGTIDQFFVGVASSPQNFGLFSLARRLTQQPTQMMNFAVSRAVFPAFIRIKEMGASPVPLFLSAIRLSLLVASLPLLLIAVLASDLLLLALGPDWLPAAPYLALFAAISSTQTMGAVLSATLRAQGKTDYQFIFQVSRIILSTIVLYLVVQNSGSTWDIAVAMSLIALLFLLPSATLSCRELQVSLGQWTSHVLRGLLPGLCMAALCYFTVQSLTDTTPPLTRICLTSLLGCAIWFGLGAITSPELRLWKHFIKGTHS